MNTVSEWTLPIRGKQSAMPTSEQWYDITRPIQADMPVWPGDPAPEILRLADLAEGDFLTLTSLRVGAHLGTHVDAPRHYLATGATIDAMPPAAMVGPARVVALPGCGPLTAADLVDLEPDPGSRLLLKTANADLPTTGSFHREFVGLTLDAARHLAGRNLLTLGLDYLSVAAWGEDQAAIHRLFFEAGTWLIEGLDLGRVSPGRYDLFCLPLLLPGVEAAPARVLLRRPAGSRQVPLL